MEYIQCSHCNKKYGVNDKVRAAAGRNITCKACGNPFEIVLFETPSPSIPETNQDAAKNETIESTSEEQDSPKKQPKKRRNTRADAESEPLEKKRVSPSMLLGIAIVVLSVYVFYQDRSIDIGKPFVATETPKPSNKPASTFIHEEEAPINTEAQDISQTKLSEACKAIAAQEWVIDYTMMHGMPDSNEYVHSIDESIQNTAEIRKICGGASIVQEILSTATEGIPPKWLEKHVSALITLDKQTPHF